MRDEERGMSAFYVVRDRVLQLYPRECARPEKRL